MSPSKKFVFYVIMVSIPVLALVLPVGGYLAYRKLTFSYDYCGSYGQFDAALGWRLKPDASSCLSLTNRLKGIVYFFQARSTPMTAVFVTPRPAARRRTTPS